MRKNNTADLFCCFFNVKWVFYERTLITISDRNKLCRLPRNNMIYKSRLPLSIVLLTVNGLVIIINLLVAALSGIFIPLLLEKAGADPALAGGVLLTTVTDQIGFFAFLGLASQLLI